MYQLVRQGFPGQAWVVFDVGAGGEVDPRIERRSEAGEVVRNEGLQKDGEHFLTGVFSLETDLEAGDALGAEGAHGVVEPAVSKVFGGLGHVVTGH